MQTNKVNDVNDVNNGIVTIVTAARDAARFLAECGRSVFAQSHSQWRWVIVNDGSTDGTGEMAYSYAFQDARARVVNQRQKGVSAARNAAFSQVDHPTPESTSEFVLFLDADDELTPKALEKLVALARRYPGSPAVAGAFTLIDEFGQPVEWWPQNKQLDMRERGYLTANMLTYDNPLWNPAQVLIRRTALEQAMEDDHVFDERFSIGEDWDLWRRITALGTVICEPFVTVHYRKHEGGVTTKRRPELMTAMAQVAAKHKQIAITNNLIDPLLRVEIQLEIPHEVGSIQSSAQSFSIQQKQSKQLDLAVWTMASRGFDGQLDSFLGSFHQNAQLPRAPVFVLNMGNDAACCRVIHAHAASGLSVSNVPCRALARPAPSIKAALYTVAEIVDADHYLCLDVDTLILQSLFPLWQKMCATPSNKIHCALDANGDYSWTMLGDLTIGQYLAAVYSLWLPTFEDRWKGMGVPIETISYVCNDGVFGGSRTAMLQLSQTLRSWMPRERYFLDEHHIRNQLLFNLALAHDDAFARLDDLFNVQVHAVRESLKATKDSLFWHHDDGIKQPAIVHFTGYTKDEFPTLQQSFRLMTMKNKD